MAISNNSTGLRTGVCLSSTRPTAPYEGQVIFETDTDKMLVWNGSAWVIPNSPAQNPDGLALVTSATFASTNDLIISDIFSSTYTNYKIIFEVDTSSTSVGISFQFRNSGGNLSGSYYSSTAQTDIGTTGVARLAENNSTGSLAMVAYDTLDYGFCHLEVMRPFETAYTMFINSNMNYRPSTAFIESRFGSGAYQQTTSVTGIHFYTGSAATFAGKYFVYGYRN